MIVSYKGCCVGCQHRPNEAQDCIKELIESTSVINSDHCKLNIAITKDPDNAYDPNAVKVFILKETGEFIHVGYIPKDDTNDAAVFLDFLSENLLNKTIESYKTQLIFAKKSDDKITWFNFEVIIEIK